MQLSIRRMELIPILLYERNMNTARVNFDKSNHQTESVVKISNPEMISSSSLVIEFWRC